MQIRENCPRSSENPLKLEISIEKQRFNSQNPIKDQNLKLTLAFGIGMHHAGLVERDRKTVEELYLNQKIQVRLFGF